MQNSAALTMTAVWRRFIAGQDSRSPAQSPSLTPLPVRPYASAMCLRCRPVLWFALAAILVLAAPRSARASTLPYIPLDHWVTPFITEAIGRGILPGLSLADRPYGRESIARALRAERA